MQKVFEALASAPRRKILAFLAEAELNAGEIASRFAMSKPAVSQHLAVLENAGLVASEKRGDFLARGDVTSGDRFDFVAQNADVRPPVAGIHREGARRHTSELDDPRRVVGMNGIGHLSVDDPRRDDVGRKPAERSSGDHLPKHHARAEHVGTVIEGIAAQPLGSHVPGGIRRQRRALFADLFGDEIGVG